MYGTCFAEDGQTVITEKLKDHWDPRHDPMVSSTSNNNNNNNKNNKNQLTNYNPRTMLILSELDMLIKGKYFLGSFYSNFVRLVHYLRYPHLQESFHFLRDQRSANRENMEWYF
jgi:hypothetical protein